MNCPIGTDVERAARTLAGGGLVAFATETVYGLGANALDTRPVARIFSVKGRPQFDPLIVHVADPNWLERLVISVPNQARRLIDRFWPGPLTLVLPKTTIVPDLVTAGLPTVGVRMPAHELALELIKRADTPIAAPVRISSVVSAPRRRTTSRINWTRTSIIFSMGDPAPSVWNRQSWTCPAVLQLCFDPAESVASRSKKSLERLSRLPRHQLRAVHSEPPGCSPRTMRLERRWSSRLSTNLCLPRRDSACWRSCLSRCSNASRPSKFCLRLATWRKPPRTCLPPCDGSML